MLKIENVVENVQEITAYPVHYQEYDVTGLIESRNTLSITLGKGWCFSRLSWNEDYFQPYRYKSPAVICALRIVFTDGTEQAIYSDESFTAAKSGILYSEIYDGEIFDANVVQENWVKAEKCGYLCGNSRCVDDAHHFRCPILVFSGSKQNHE